MEIREREGKGREGEGRRGEEGGREGGGEVLSCTTCTYHNIEDECTFEYNQYTYMYNHSIAYTQLYTLY